MPSTFCNGLIGFGVRIVSLSRSEYAVAVVSPTPRKPGLVGIKAETVVVVGSKTLLLT